MFKSDSFFSKVVNRVKDNISKRRRNRRWLAFSLLFRDAGGHLGSFYLPLFFYKMAQTMDFWHASFTDVQKGMILISFYYLFQRLFSATANFAQARFTLKTGHEQAMLLGSAVKTLWLLSLTYIDKNPWFLILATLLAGIENGFFWPSYRTLVCRLSFSKEMGKSLAGFRFLGNFLTMLVPALGGLVVSFLGYNYLFYVSILLIIISMIGTIQLDVDQEKDDVSLSEYISWMKEKTYNLLVLSQMGRYFYDISIVLWPLFVFLLIGDVTKVGYIYSFTFFVVLALNLFIGEMLDKKKKVKKTFLISGGILSLISMLKIYVTGAWDVVILDSCNRMLGDLYWLMHDKILFARGRGSQVFSYFVYREVNRSIAAVCFWFLLLIFFLIVRVDWTGLFALGSAGVLLSMLAREKK